MTGLALRNCSRNGCGQPAVATLTYSYADSTAVLGPLSTAAEPHAYDLCAEHTQRLTVPRGWEVVRLALREQDLQRQDDLLDLADAVRPNRSQEQTISLPTDPVDVRDRASAPSGAGTPRRPRYAAPTPRGGHLRAVDEGER